MINSYIFRLIREKEDLKLYNSHMLRYKKLILVLPQSHNLFLYSLLNIFFIFNHSPNKNIQKYNTFQTRARSKRSYFIHIYLILDPFRIFRSKSKEKINKALRRGGEYNNIQIRARNIRKN